MWWHVQKMRHDCVNIWNIRERLVLFWISLTYTGWGVAGGGGSRVVCPSRAAESRGRQLCRQIFNENIDFQHFTSFKLLSRIWWNWINVIILVRNFCSGQPLWLLAPGSKSPAYAIQLRSTCVTQVIPNFPINFVPTPKRTSQVKRKWVICAVQP